MSHQAVWYRIRLQNKKNTFLNLFYFKIPVMLEGEHSAQTVYDIG